MRTTEKASTVLTAVGARRLTDKLITTLTAAHEQLIELWQGRAWEALDYPNWDTFCREELGDLLLVRLPPEKRREVAAHMKEAGMSYRNIATPLSVSPASIHADLAPPKPKSVQKLNTPEEPAPLLAEDVEALTNWQSVVRHVGRAGQRGQTCLEFEAESAWGHGKSSAAFHAAERKGYISRDGRFRSGYAVYVRSSAQ